VPNRDRLLAGEIAHKFLAAMLSHPQVARLLSSEGSVVGICFTPSMH